MCHDGLVKAEDSMKRPTFLRSSVVAVSLVGFVVASGALAVPSAARTTAAGRPAAAAGPPTVARHVPRGLGGRVWYVLPTRRKVVAITIDGGWNDAGVAKMLATLRRDHVRATFNLTGRFCRHYPAAAKAIAAAGELIGNLSNNHPHFTEIKAARMRMEVRYGQAEIKQVTGVDPWPWFRFPYGLYDAQALKVVNALGYVPIEWTVDTLGWEGRPAGITVRSIVNRALENLQPGEIILMHFAWSFADHSILDADALPIVIAKIRAAGYSFVTINALRTMVR
jgi:peptidoglycan/xylan/chitin deacetylase (PgdA/CDA1 family)